MLNDIVITGVGITSAFGQGKTAFSSALFNGKNAFKIMQRFGRKNELSFIGTEIPDMSLPGKFSKRSLRNISLSSQIALITLDEAWDDANLYGIDPYRIGLIVGGSNLQQRELINTYETFTTRMFYIPPTYGFSFLDTDICGICTEQFTIKGLAYTLGGASASGQISIIQAIQSILSGQLDICIVIGALMDLSYWECQALRSLGAMGSDRFFDEPGKACRPFDKNRDGFIYGESCGIVVIESLVSAANRSVKNYAKISGWAIAMDGNRGPNPSYNGEIYVIKKALEIAKLCSHDIDYINPHGTGSIIGDETEIKAIMDSGLSGSYINTTKSITGHGLSSAGTVEVIATLIQMQEGKLHPSRNLEDPINLSCNWVHENVINHQIQNAINLSMGFGGINTALCIQKN